MIKLWKIPNGGLVEDLEIPHLTLSGHTKRINLLQFHPIVDKLIASVSAENSIWLWNWEVGKAEIALQGHSNSIEDISWSPNGKLLATSCKDKKLRIYDPRAKTSPVQVIIIIF